MHITKLIISLNEAKRHEFIIIGWIKVKWISLSQTSVKGVKIDQNTPNGSNGSIICEIGVYVLIWWNWIGASGESSKKGKEQIG